MSNTVKKTPQFMRKHEKAIYVLEQLGFYNMPGDWLTANVVPHGFLDFIAMDIDEPIRISMKRTPNETVIELAEILVEKGFGHKGKVSTLLENTETKVMQPNLINKLFAA